MSSPSNSSLRLAVQLVISGIMITNCFFILSILLLPLFPLLLEVLEMLPKQFNDERPLVLLKLQIRPFSLQEIIKKLFSQAFIPQLFLLVSKSQLHQSKRWIWSLSFNKSSNHFFRWLQTPLDIRIVLYSQQGIHVAPDSSLLKPSGFLYVEKEIIILPPRPSFVKSFPYKSV